MSSFPDRPRYEGSVGISWMRLPALLGGALLAAISVAWLLKFAFTHNWYLIIVLPMLGAGALAGVCYLLVDKTRCRNRWLAGIVGGLAGLVAYLGYYQFCMAEFLPPQWQWRADLLPRYIAFRMNTDVAQDVAKPQIGAPKPFAPLNWGAFAVELLIITVLPAAFAWNRASFAYISELGTWMQRETVLLPAFIGPHLVDALDMNKLEGFLQRASAVGPTQMGCQFVLEYVKPADGWLFDYPIYASLEDLPTSRPWYRPKSLRRTLLKQVELEAAEVLALRQLFPKLAQLVGTQHPGLGEQSDQIVLRSPSAAVPVFDRAQVLPVPDPYRQQVRTKGYALKVNLIGLIPVVEILGGLGLALLGLRFVEQGSLPLGWGTVIIGAMAALWGCYTAVFCMAIHENRWIERRLRREIHLRPDPLVDAQDPESTYVALIPRANFSKIKLTMSSDLLLLKVDEHKRQLLLEGDIDRYRIPAAAIAACEPQCFFHPVDAAHKNQLWMIRLMVQVEQGVQELLLSVGNTSFHPMTNARRCHIAEAMCARISAALQS